MEERKMIKKQYYEIPLKEKIHINLRRSTILVYYLLRYKLRKIIPTEFVNAKDVFRKYFLTYDVPYIKKQLNIQSDDIHAAVKILTYLHSLSGTTGYISELSDDRIVRIETDCPIQNKVSKHFCSEVMSYPTFCAVCSELNKDIVHKHNKFLSGGDSVCELIFEYRS